MAEIDAQMAAFSMQMEMEKHSSDEEEEKKKKYKFGDGIRAIKKKVDEKKREDRERTPSEYHEPTRPLGKIKQALYKNKRVKNRNVTIGVIG